MRFNQIYFLIFLTILCSEISYCVNSGRQNWHVVDTILFYIEVQQKENISEAYQFCKSIGMGGFIWTDSLSQLQQYIHGFYGYIPPLWPAFVNDYTAKEEALMLLEEDDRLRFVNKSSSIREGFVCSVEILNGEITFKNGSVLAVNKNDVIKYCDPQAEKAFNQKYCLIFLDN